MNKHLQRKERFYSQRFLKSDSMGTTWCGAFSSSYGLTIENKNCCGSDDCGSRATNWNWPIASYLCYLSLRANNITTKLTKPLSSLKLFHSQDLIHNSPYCRPYNSYDVSSENLVLDQLIIPKLLFFFILITRRLDIVWHCEEKLFLGHFWELKFYTLWAPLHPYNDFCAGCQNAVS